jgi:hypothetical protein
MQPAASVNQAHPGGRQLGLNPVKPGIGLIQQEFCPDTRDQNGPPPIFTSIKIGRRVKMG